MSSHPPGLPSGVPPDVAEKISYNELLDYGGQCQFYVLPPGGEHNGTTIFKPDEMILYAVNCDLTQTEYMNLWISIHNRYSRAPFRISLTPLMVVISICTVASWIVMGSLVILRRHTRPWFHYVILVYACVMVNVLFGYLHYFSRLEHMYGHESTDSFIQFFYGTSNAAAIFVVFLGFMFCECQIIFTLYTDANKRFWILCGCGAFIIFENSWWIAGIFNGHIYDIMNRKLDFRLRVYFYLEVLGHLLFYLSYAYRFLSMWKYSFYKNNRALGIICLISGLFPFAAILATAIVKDCFPWTLPLSMVIRALNIVLVWDWYTQTLKTKARLENEDTLGRLITEVRVKNEFKAKLDGTGEGHGMFVSDSFAARIIEKILHPRSIVSSVSIVGVGAHESDEQESGRTDTDNDGNNSNAHRHHNTPYLPNDAIQHHPVAKHTVKVNNNGGNVLRPRFDRSLSQNSSNKHMSKNTGVSLSGVTTLSSTAHSSQARASNSGGSSNMETASNSETGVSSGASFDPSDQSRQTQPPCSSNAGDVASGVPGPSSPAEAPQESSARLDAPPKFVPHPGFRSGDYNDEKGP